MAGPAVMTFSTLSAQVSDYLNRTDADTLAMIPYFIYQAENRISRECKVLGIESYVTGTFIAGQSVYAKPSRWRRNLSINFGTGTNNNTRNQLFLRSYEYIREFAQDSTAQGIPQYYADYGYENIVIGPTPNANYPFEWCYLQLPDPISSSNQVSWLTNYAPDLLLYATLLESASFLKDDERLPMWQSMYDRALASLNSQDDARVVDRASNRTAD